MKKGWWVFKGSWKHTVQWPWGTAWIFCNCWQHGWSIMHEKLGMFYRLCTKYSKLPCNCVLCGLNSQVLFCGINWLLTIRIQTWRKGQHQMSTIDGGTATFSCSWRNASWFTQFRFNHIWQVTSLEFYQIQVYSELQAIEILQYQLVFQNFIQERFWGTFFFCTIL